MSAGVKLFTEMSANKNTFFTYSLTLCLCFRDSEAVIVSPSCSLLKLRSTVLEVGLLDSSTSLADRPIPLQGVQATCRAGQGTPTTPLPPQGDQQVLAVATDKGVSVFALPSQRLTANSPLGEGVIVIRKV